MPSSYFPLDVNFFDHPKVVPLGDLAVRLYLASVAYANRLMTDGFIAHGVLGRLIDVPWDSDDRPDDYAKELIRAVLWHRADEPCPRGHADTCPKVDGDGWRIHDFLDHNRSRESRVAAQESERDRKAAWRQRQRDADVPRDTSVPGDAGRGRTRDVKGTGNTETETYTKTDTRKINTVVEQARPLAVIPGGFSDDPADILDVWETWKASAGKKRADLNPTRRQAITKALASYPVQDVLDAVQGWVHDPWPERPQHNDITQLLHMGTQRKPLNVLEKMRDLWRDGPPHQVSKQTAQAIRTSMAMRARAEEVNGDLRRMGRPRGPAERGLSAPAD